jgi:type II secretory pathway pseudopilin PulG
MRSNIRLARQHGAALVIGLILLAIITLLAVVGMNVSNSELQSATSEQLRLRAFQAAETGVENAIADTVFKVGTTPGAKQVSAAIGIAGSPINPADGKAMDSYKTTVQYCGEAPIAPKGFTIGSFTAFHYSIASDGSSARGALSRLEQGVYQINQTGQQDSFAALPAAPGGGAGCT